MALLPLLLLFIYTAGIARLARKGRAWPLRRLASFVLGCSLAFLALSPPFVLWAHAELRMHMAQHLLLGMFTPLALMLGAPGTLLLNSLPTLAARGLVRLLATRPLRVLIHPLTALLLDIGALYLLYLTPLFALSQGHPAAHAFLQLHFLVAGYLFCWSIAGPDPAPHRPGPRLRLAVLFLAIAAHASLAKLMYAYGFPRGTLHDPREIQAAAELMYYGGDLAELLLAVVFFAGWLRRRRRADGAQPLQTA